MASRTVAAPLRLEGEGGWAVAGPPPRLLSSTASGLPLDVPWASTPPTSSKAPRASVGARPNAAAPTALIAAASTISRPPPPANGQASPKAGPSGSARPSSASAASALRGGSSSSTSSTLTTPQGLLNAGGFETIFGMMLLHNAALPMKMPILPTIPIVPGISGMSARNTLHPFGPMQQVTMQARSTAAAEALVNPLNLIPEGPEHPNYQPAIPMWYALRKLMAPGMI